MNEKTTEKCTISAEIQQALSKLGYQTLTKVQEEVIPLVLARQDAVVSAQTGSGKTAAFAIPVCERILIEQKDPQVLVLTPTRELAVQVRRDIADIGRFKGVRCAAVFGREAMALQKRELRQRVHVVVGTPGRTLDHLAKGNLQMSALQYLIIDEADKMLNMGFIEQVEAILQQVPADRVTLLFSATMPTEIQELARQYLKQPQYVSIVEEGSKNEQIQQGYYETTEADKSRLLAQIIHSKQPESGIIFCNTREKAENIFRNMKYKGYSCGNLHGGMEQKERLLAIRQFKRGEVRFLIATDVAARGIHVDDIALIINYDFPGDYETYVHRIGRTGRAGKAGEAITLLTGDEIGKLQGLEEYLQYRIPGLSSVGAEDGAEAALPQTGAVSGNLVIKEDKSQLLNQEITRIRINAGKKAKMRPGDILGAVGAIDGISSSDIGIIDIQDTCSYVEIFGDKGHAVLTGLLNSTIKGKRRSIKQVGFSDR